MVKTLVERGLTNMSCTDGRSISPALVVRIQKRRGTKWLRTARRQRNSITLEKKSGSEKKRQF